MSTVTTPTWVCYPAGPEMRKIAGDVFDLRVHAKVNDEDCIMRVALERERAEDPSILAYTLKWMQREFERALTRFALYGIRP